VWRHPEQFRCLTMRKSTGHVLAGTEQHSIVAFPFSEALASMERQREQVARKGEDKAERVNKEVATAAAPADLVPIRVPVAGEAPKAGSGG